MKITSQEDRQKIKELVASGLKSKDISQIVGWSVKTVEKWRSRLQKSLDVSLIGRPKLGAMSHFPDALRDRIKDLREEYHALGGKMLYWKLHSESGGIKLPSPATIDRYLKHKGLVRTNEKHEPLPHISKIVAKEPHDLWQIDGQGNEQVGGVGIVCMLNLKDVISSLHVSIYPKWMKSKQSHPTTQHYQTAVRLGAIHHGLPRQIQSDHASVFYDNHSKSPFPTLFFLWLIALGVDPVFSRIHRPEDQGKVEKSHQTMWAQVDRRTPYQNWEHFFEHCQKRRVWLNEIFPSTACGDKPPLKAFPQARHSGRPYSLALERTLLSLDRVYDYLEKGCWWRRVSKDLTISLGKQVYYLKEARPNTQVQIRFRKSDRTLLISLVNELCFTCPLKGISLDVLIGDVQLPLPGIQLKLPFEENDKLLRLFDIEPTMT